MSAQMQPRALPERAVRGGAQVVVRVTRRTVGLARPSGATRVQRLAATLLLVPALAFVLVLGAVFLALLLAAMLFFALTVGTIVVRRRLARPR